MQTKYCAQCKMEKSTETDFSKDKSKPDGRCFYCKTCRSAMRKIQHALSPDAANQRAAKYRKEHPDRAAKAIKNWQQSNMRKVAANTRKWRAANPHKMNYYGAKRRSQILERTPAWQTDADRARIEMIYQCAKVWTETSGVLHHVDHILPLVGKLVSGLHVPDNLQILTASENSRKSNTWTPE